MFFNPYLCSFIVACCLFFVGAWAVGCGGTFPWSQKRLNSNSIDTAYYSLHKRDWIASANAIEKYWIGITHVYMHLCKHIHTCSYTCLIWRKTFSCPPSTTPPPTLSCPLSTTPPPTPHPRLPGLQTTTVPRFLCYNRVLLQPVGLPNLLEQQRLSIRLHVLQAREMKAILHYCFVLLLV